MVRRVVFVSRTCTHILVDVEARTCRSRGAHVACTRTYNGQGARKKIRPRICTYGRGLKRLLMHTNNEGSCTWRGRNGETTSSSCSWGGNGMHGRVHREGLDGTGDGNEAWHTRERRKQPCVRPATFKTGSCSSGGVWRTAKRRKRTSYGRNGSPVDRGGVAYRKTEETDLCWSAKVKTGVLLIGRGVAYRKTGLHGILFISTVDPLQPPRATVHPPSTSSSLHGLLFIQPPPRAPPPATVQPPLHHLLFIQPPHHGVLFNHPSTGTPPPSTVH